MTVKRLNFSIARKVLLYSILIGVIFTSGYGLGINGFKLETGKFPSVKISREVPDNRDVDFGLFWKVWGLLRDKYVDSKELDSKKLFYGAIDGMLAATGDPYTTFFSPEENAEFKEEI